MHPRFMGQGREGGREGGRGTYLRSVAGMGVMKARAGVARARKEMVRIFR